MSASAACATSKDAAAAAALAYYSNYDGAYPQEFNDLTHPPTGRPLLDTSSAKITSPTTLRGKDGWTLSDLDSKNGVHLDGVRAASISLVPGA